MCLGQHWLLLAIMATHTAWIPDCLNLRLLLMNKMSLEFLNGFIILKSYILINCLAGYFYRTPKCRSVYDAFPFILFYRIPTRTNESLRRHDFTKISADNFAMRVHAEFVT